MAYKSFKTIDDFNLQGKRVLLRVDINSEIINNRPIMSDRIKLHSQTISLLKKRKAKVIVIAHQSNPGKYDFTSLKNHVRLINKYTKIKFVKDIIGKKAENGINNLKDGQAILLENIRFLKEEFTPSKTNKLTKFFKDKIDIYINDSLSVSHRDQTSITIFPLIFKSAAGPVLINELRNIEKIKFKDSLYILGGNKIEDVMLLVNRNILSTGLFSVLCLIAEGNNLGLENKALRKQMKYLKTIKKNLPHIKTPIDLAFSIKGKRKEINLNELPTNHLALDIGAKTIEYYKREIRKARRIFWKGTAGNIDIKGFSTGTISLLKEIEKSNAFCVIAGGHSSTAIDRFHINRKKIGYISISGGALLYYIAGKKLPGLEALK